jgi:L-ascorbate metabolism protein UlaG (beta-lactamase superfamily)
MTTARYLGWSGFLLEDSDQRVAIDPHWSGFGATGSLPTFDLTPLTGIVISHGHPDHVADVPTLLRLHPRSWAVADITVAAWLRDKVPDARDRITTARSNETVLKDGVEITLRPGVHVGDSGLHQLRKLLRYVRRSPWATLQLLRATHDSPSTAGVYSIELKWPDGDRVLHAAETVHRGAPSDAATGLAGTGHDLFLLGVEPGEEEACRREMVREGSKQTLLFSPHAGTREVFSDDAQVEWDLLIGAVSGAQRAFPVTDLSP